MMDNLEIIIGVVLSVLTILLLLPKILSSLGLHPHYDEKTFTLTNKNALIITTSHDTLGQSGKSTGVFASEMTVPYYEFLDAGLTVDLASIKGGKIPVEASSKRYPLATKADKRFFKDEEALRKLNQSLLIDEVDFTDYDIIFMAGGWGAAYDLGYSQTLGDKLSIANSKNILLGSVCHGALGFRMATSGGKPLVEGRKITAVTDKQIKELRITDTPLHPETELRKQNAIFKSNTKLLDILATNVVIDQNIVSGQNQNSAGVTAQELLRILNEKE
jgi:putative intracellular protease/amidase